MTLLYVHALSATDSHGRLLLDRVSLHLDEGQVLGLAGGPGAGKSLFCAILAGAPPDGIAVAHGRILLGNRDLAAQPWLNDGVVAVAADGRRLAGLLVAVDDRPRDAPPPTRPVPPAGGGAIVTHRSPRLLAAACDEIAVLCAGRLVERAPTPALLAMPRHPYTRALLDGAEAGGDLASVSEGCPYRPECPAAAPACAEASLRLQMISLDHATACERHRALWPAPGRPAA